MREKPTEIHESRVGRALRIPSQERKLAQSDCRPLSLTHVLLRSAFRQDHDDTLAVNLPLLPEKAMQRTTEQNRTHSTQSEEREKPQLPTYMLCDPESLIPAELEWVAARISVTFLFSLSELCSLRGSNCAAHTPKIGGCAPPLWEESIYMKYLELFCMEDLSITLISLLNQWFLYITMDLWIFVLYFGLQFNITLHILLLRLL